MCCVMWLRAVVRFQCGVSVSGRFTDLIVNLREGLLTAQFLSQSVIQLSIKHLPELLPLHVHICIQHLEPAGGRCQGEYTYKSSVNVKTQIFIKHLTPVLYSLI